MNTNQQQLDLAQWMFRGLPTEIFVLGRVGPTDAARGPDYVQIHLGFPHGGMAVGCKPCGACLKMAWWSLPARGEPCCGAVGKGGKPGAPAGERK